jgi:hypothetical protein
MRDTTTVTASLLIGVLLTGCAASPAKFYADSASLSDTTLCRTLKAATSANDAAFTTDVRRAAQARNLTDYSCQALVNRQNAAIAAGAVIGVALVAAARNGGGGTSVGANSNSGYDYEWDWDQFFNQNRQLIWACRGVQTGQFAYAHQCAGKPQSDWRWPQK